MPVGLHSGRVWRNSIFSLFPSLVDIYAELLLRMKTSVALLNITSFHCVVSNNYDDKDIEKHFKVAQLDFSKVNPSNFEYKS